MARVVVYTLTVIAMLLVGAVAAWAEGTITNTSRCALEWNAPTTNADGTPLVDLAGYGVYIADTPAALAALTAPTAFVPSPSLNPTAGTKASWACHSTATPPGRPLPVGQKYSQLDAVDQVGNRSARTPVVPFELRDGVPPSTPTGLVVVPLAGP